MLEEKNLLVRTYNPSHQDFEIRGCASDSRYVYPLNIFVCKGRAFKPSYLMNAVIAGATAFMCQEHMAAPLARKMPGVPYITVRDIRLAMAWVSAMSYDYPDLRIPIVGITGTKGKSSVSYMLRSIVDQKEKDKAAIIGSIETYDGVERKESTNTTPEAPDLWRHISYSADTKKSPLIMEVSSQGLKYDRVLGVHFEIGCFLNIDRDHISPVEHPSFEDYFESKLKLFKSCKKAVVNLDSDHIEEIMDAASSCETVLTCSSRSSTADVWASDIESMQGSICFLAHTPEWTDTITLTMPGLFNIDNALAAIAIATLLGIDASQIKAGLASTKVPGRMELIDYDNSRIQAIADYAHNRLSFQKFFESCAEEFKGYKMIAVFGAVGDKCQERRKELPEVAAQWADKIIYTEDDPAHEKVEDICADLIANTPEGCDYQVIANREKAIFKAVEIASETDEPCLICLLAKGDTTTQHVGDSFVPMKPDAQSFIEAMQQLGL